MRGRAASTRSTTSNAHRPISTPLFGASTGSGARRSSAMARRPNFRNRRPPQSMSFLSSIRRAAGALVAVAALGAAPVAAGSPTEFVEKFGDNAVKVLADGGLNEDQKIDHFRRLLNDGFDVSLIGRMVLGPRARTASETQMKEYTALFEKFIVASSAQRLNRYSGEQLNVKGSHPDGRDVIVHSEIQQGPGKPAVKVDWRVRGEDPNFKIVDIIVEGVSMVITQRDEFASVVQRCGGKLDCLLDRLRTRPQGLNTAAGGAR
ncbi:MAG: ABC transporter substrate-binding protein [Alphaproteobacteria bacterium]|nr:ABC transporter substrate-binding protein [Alphaproteobacteria bacterium]